MSDGRWIYDDGPVVYWMNDKKKCTCKTPIIREWDQKTNIGRCMCGGAISVADYCHRRVVKQ